MTDSQNMTESNQQNGKEKLHANPVSAQEVKQSKEYSLLPVPPIAQGSLWLCGCNLSTLRKK